MTTPAWFVICPGEEFPMGDPRVSAFDPPKGLAEGDARTLASSWDRVCDHCHVVVQGAPQAHRAARTAHASLVA